jgi:hypothetical protein
MDRVRIDMSSSHAMGFDVPEQRSSAAMLSATLGIPGDLGSAYQRPKQ